MERRVFGATGVRVPVIGLGTWKMESDPRASVIAAIHRALDLGASHVDTAELYGSGEVETIVGEAIAGRRDEVFLVSKVMPSNASFEGTVRAAEQSLERLKTDRLDCYLLHWPGDEPLEETIAAFEELVRSGKIRSWGVSNFDVAELDAASKIAGEGKIACNQVLYHLGERAIEHAVIPWCEQHGVAVVGYSPLGQGAGVPAAGRSVLSEIAAAHGATAEAVALAFLVRRPSLFTIPKSSRVEHVEANAAAGSLTLSDEEIARIDRAFPRGRRPKALPVL